MVMARALGFKQDGTKTKKKTEKEEGTLNRRNETSDDIHPNGQRTYRPKLLTKKFKKSHTVFPNWHRQ